MTAPDPRTDLGAQAVVAGDPFTWTITVQLNGAAQDLTTIGTTWAADLRQSPGASPEIPFAVDSSQASTGVLKLSLTAAQTTSMASGNGHVPWYFDVQATGGTVSPQTTFKGTLVVYKGNI